MGFIVSQSIEDRQGRALDSFYVRIENYQLNKIQGYVGASVNHYESAEEAKLSIPDFIEDTPTGKGCLSVSMSYNGEWKEWPMWYKFPVTQSVLVTETFTTSSWDCEVVTYIDFDEDGNEVTGSREEWTETVITGSREVTKSLKNMSSLTGSIYDFVYTQLKGNYREIFGYQNIIDEI